MTNKGNSVLYTGVTNNLERRVYEHQNKLIEGFTKKYNATKLVYYEMMEDVTVAIEREKQIKGWLRKKNSFNGIVESLLEEFKPNGFFPFAPLGVRMTKIACSGSE